MQQVRWAEFHSSIFHAGKNFTNKIEVAGHKGLELLYDEEKRHFVLKYNKRVSYLPETSALIWEPVTEIDVPLVINEHKTEDKSKRSKAQVATPQSHVFEGRGSGLK